MLTLKPKFVIVVYCLLFVFTCFQVQACSSGKKKDAKTEENLTSKTDTMTLKITIGEKTARAVLYDNPTSRDFASLLPLTLKLEDYANTEKVSGLPKKLSTKNAPTGFDPSVGDITYFAPWGNIALFYKDFGYSNGLISLGKITSGMEAFQAKGSFTIKIEFDAK